MRIPRQGRSSLRVNLSTSSQEPPGDAQASQQLEINMPEPQSQQTEDRASSQSTRTRGATAAADVWSMPSDEKIDLEFNEDGQPINENAKRLTRFLGSIARNGNKLPIDVDSWRDVPIETKEEVWKVVQTKFKTKENDKDFVLKSLSKKWRGRDSCRLKISQFDESNAKFHGSRFWEFGWGKWLFLRRCLCSCNGRRASWLSTWGKMRLEERLRNGKEHLRNMQRSLVAIFNSETQNILDGFEVDLLSLIENQKILVAEGIVISSDPSKVVGPQTLVNDGMRLWLLSQYCQNNHLFVHMAQLEQLEQLLGQIFLGYLYIFVFGVTALLPLITSTVVLVKGQLMSRYNLSLSGPGFFESSKQNIIQLWNAVRPPNVFLPTLFIFLWQATPQSGQTDLVSPHNF
uniref:Uncharacterized protein n=1 Tax=Nelumbo nucifera TaxID=4432 RepID=A0A822Z123_NELNU|nr:TPA_asm: hypothetical protein HUJ06_007806 [Nelumbo nucifera]